MLNNRLPWIDLTRFIAILMVVGIHSVDEVIRTRDGISETSWVLFQSMRIIGRLGVPLFLLISGALVIVSASKLNPIDFYKKRIPQFFLVFVFYYIATNYIRYHLRGVPVDIPILEERFMRGDNNYAYQIWFLYSITGLYLIAPFLGRMLLVLTDKQILGFVFLNFIFCFLPTFQSIFFGSSSPITFFGNEFMGSYLTYFILGYAVVQRNLLNSISISLSLIVSALGFSALLLSQIYLKHSGHFGSEGFTWYNSPLIFITGLFVFLAASKLRDVDFGRFSKTLSFLGDSSFCVFLFHLIPLPASLFFLNHFSLPWPLEVLAVMCFVYVSSLTYYIAMRKLPYFKKLVS